MNLRKGFTDTARRHFEAAGRAATAALDQAGLSLVQANQSSRLERAGRRMVQGAFLLQAMETILVSPSDGVNSRPMSSPKSDGSLFGGTDRVSEGVRSHLLGAQLAVRDRSLLRIHGPGPCLHAPGFRHGAGRLCRLLRHRRVARPSLQLVTR